MRVCPLFEHLLNPSLTDDVFQITHRQEKLMEDKHLQAYNESQRHVISEAVSMIQDTKDDEQAKIYMCQGPPGTGKSQTITGIVRSLLQVFGHCGHCSNRHACVDVLVGVAHVAHG